ncbi:relaxosome protein TraM [Xenorhabdus sp. XENO-1]|uniref:conjugal transfer relaxosome DNA-binding protein TraM n=1 Tax=Xenorhabdus bovienii TaxID=40576 RepID=UPI0020CA4920|nr:conjugal transfer relaxosome DNA-binding protein TraM [Xenorhabdus bovienii]MCP9269135.1 relaxosome protein TraM [Xenorhabdus bovienii subsp. africana]
MARIQSYVSDETEEKIRMIMEKHRSSGAKEKDVSISSITAMLLELGVRVYEAQMERKESGFNQTEYNKIMLEFVSKIQYSTAKLLGIASLSPHVSGEIHFEYKSMVEDIKEHSQEIVSRFFLDE